LNKAPDAFRTISEVAKELDLPQHVLRFWESRFPHIKPLKRGGGRRYYRPEDVDLLRGIRHLLYGDGYTIRGVQRILREQGVRTVQSVGQGILTLPEKAKGEESELESFALELPFPSAMLAQIDEGDHPAADETEVEQPPPPVSRSARAWREDALPLMAAPEPPSQRSATPVSHAPPSVTPPSAAQPSATPSSPPARPTPTEVETSPANAAPPIMPLSGPPLELDRLKAALAELEACRRLLDRALNDE